jgi:site-specific DNA recombinase
MNRVAQSSAGVTTALIYTRVSTAEQGDNGVSLAAQLTECRAYARQRGWIIGNEHSDVMSGRRDSRPGYVALLAEMRALRMAGKAVAVVAADFDRLGRRASEILRMAEECKAAQVEIHAPRKGGRLHDVFIGALAFVASVESSNTGTRVKATRRSLASQGWPVPGRLAWGMLWRDSTDEERAQGAGRRMLDLHPDQAPFVAEMFRRSAAGASLRTLCRWVASLPETARGGRSMNVAATRKTLSAPIYISRYGNAEDRPGEAILDQAKGRWPSLIEDATWAAVQRRFAAHQHTPLQATGRYLLAGFARCWGCGTRMTGVLDRGVARYRCQSAQNARTCLMSCPASSIDTAVLDAVKERLVPLASDHSRLKAALSRAWHDQQPADERAAHRRKAERLEAIIAKARQRLDRANDRFVDGEMPKGEYDSACARYAAEIESAHAELATLTSPSPAKKLPPLDVALRAVGGWSRAVSSADVMTQREVLRELIESVHPRRLDVGKYDIDVVWTPTGEALGNLIESLATRADVA